MNVLPSWAQEGFRQAELMTSAPLCPASKEQGMVLMSSLWRVTSSSYSYLCYSDGAVSWPSFLWDFVGKVWLSLTKRYCGVCKVRWGVVVHLSLVSKESLILTLLLMVKKQINISRANALKRFLSKRLHVTCQVIEWYFPRWFEAAGSAVVHVYFWD